MKNFIFMLFLSSPLYANSIGPIFPSTCSNSGAGGSLWINPSSGTVQDGNSASSNSIFADYLYCSGYNFNIPVGSSVTGVLFEYRRSADSGSTAEDANVNLFIAGTPLGENKAQASEDFFWTPTLTYFSYGSSTDTWKLSLSPSDINNTLFGAGVSADNTGSGNMFIDVERMTIFYTPPTQINNGKIYNGQLH